MATCQSYSAIEVQKRFDILSHGLQSLCLFQLHQRGARIWSGPLKMSRHFLGGQTMQIFFLALFLWDLSKERCSKKLASKEWYFLFFHWHYTCSPRVYSGWLLEMQRPRDKVPVFQWFYNPITEMAAFTYTIHNQIGNDTRLHKLHVKKIVGVSSWVQRRETSLKAQWLEAGVGGTAVGHENKEGSRLDTWSMGSNVISNASVTFQTEAYKHKLMESQILLLKFP